MLRCSLKIVLVIASGVFLGEVIRSAYLYRIEQDVLHSVNSLYQFKEPSLHESVRGLRTFALNTFLRRTNSSEEDILWFKTRPFLRQSALDSLTGRAVFCGESSRVMVALLRERGVRARRLYLHRDADTNHVVFEYQDIIDGKWYVVNSFIDEVLSPVLRERKEASTLVKDSTQPYTSFYHFKLAGKKFEEAPYLVSVLVDSPYLLRLMLSSLALLGSILSLVFVDCCSYGRSEQS